MLLLGNLVSQFNYISHHFYADDIQLYFSVEPNDMGDIGTLHDCLAAINEWMSLNLLQLTSYKTEALLIGSNKLVTQVPPCICPLATNVKPTSRNLSVIFDPNINFDLHINKLVQTCFFQLWNIAKIK